MPPILFNLLMWAVVILVAVPLAITLLLAVLGLSLDSILSLETQTASMICFHCGAETPANREKCKVCRKELQ